MSNILVTGGAGFIGSHLVDRLIKDAHTVTILDNLEPQVHGEGGTPPAYLNQKARFIKGDICSNDAIYKALQGIDIVFHQAAMVGVGQSMYEIEKYVSVNTCGTAKLLEAIVARKDKVKKLILASSMSIYGEGCYICSKCGMVYPAVRSMEQMQANNWEQRCPACLRQTILFNTAESKPLYSTSVYAITKKDQEEMCLTIGKAYSIPTVALRYFNVYGPRQALSNPYTGVCAIFSARIKNNNEPIIYEDGLQSRDFISVYDIVEANMLAMNNEEMNYGAFNVGTGKATTVLDVCNVLCKLYGKELKPQIQNRFRTGDIRHCIADITKIQEHGFTPRVAFEDGMQELVAWGKQVTADDSVEQAQQELREKGLVQ